MAIHSRTHPTFVDGCYACRLSTINLGASATPFRREATVAQMQHWDQQMRDDDAYRRLRRNGLQPKRTKGCSVLEQTDDALAIQGLPKYWNDREEFLVNPDADKPMTMTELQEKAASS